MAMNLVDGYVEGILRSIGEDPDRAGLRETPSRVRRAYEFLCKGYGEDPKEILSKVFPENHHEMVLVKHIQFYSLCEHHMLPFHGEAHIAYIPDGSVVGLSKLARLVECFSRRLQVQERLTSQIADSIVDALAPLGVVVVLEAEHLCMAMRGVQKPGSLTTTSAVRGVFKTVAKARAEAMSLIRS